MLVLTGWKCEANISKDMAHGNSGKTLTTEHKEKIRQKLIGRKFSEETLAKMRKNNKPSFKGRKHSEETKRKISENSKKNWENKEYRKKQVKVHTGKTGENASNWQGGLSLEEYPQEWTKTLKISIRERDKYTCQLCGEKQGDVAHDVHHIDYNKQNCNPDNLTALCKSCHAKTNFKRDKWKSFFKKRKELLEM